VSNTIQYPLERDRELQRKWLQRQGQAGALRTHPPPQNDNYAGGGRCPSCNARASIAPNRSNYHGHGRIDHHWLCKNCGHEWTTSLRVPS